MGAMKQDKTCHLTAVGTVFYSQWGVSSVTWGILRPTLRSITETCILMILTFFYLWSNPLLPGHTWLSCPAPAPPYLTLFLSSWVISVTISDTVSKMVINFTLETWKNWRRLELLGNLYMAGVLKALHTLIHLILIAPWDRSSHSCFCRPGN